MKNQNIVSISLFSGAGGLDIASFMADVPVVVSTDFDSDCIKTLRENEMFEDTEVIEGDLFEIESNMFQKIARKQKGKKIIIIGGAPVTAAVSDLVGSDAWSLVPQEGVKICLDWVKAG